MPYETKLLIDLIVGYRMTCDPQRIVKLFEILTPTLRFFLKIQKQFDYLKF